MTENVGQEKIMLQTFSRDCSLLFVFARRRNRLTSCACIFSSLPLQLYCTEQN